LLSFVQLRNINKIVRDYFLVQFGTSNPTLKNKINQHFCKI